MTKSIKANEFFEQHMAEAKECWEAPRVEAHRVKEGEKVIVNFGFSVEVSAEEDGWQVWFGQTPKFYDNEAFDVKFKSLDIQGTKELPEGATVEPVLKGETIMVQPWDDTPLGLQVTTETAGWIVTLPENGKPRFVSDADFRATYKTNAAPLDVDQQGLFRYIPQDGDTPEYYIILKEDVNFDFAEGEYTAKAGTVLYSNPSDEDGYTTGSLGSFCKSHIMPEVDGALLNNVESKAVSKKYTKKYGL